MLSPTKTYPAPLPSATKRRTSCPSAFIKKESGSGDSIKVAIRMRPLNSKETSNGAGRTWQILPGSNSVAQIAKKSDHSHPEVFTFDKAFGEDSTTKEVYDGIARKIVQRFAMGLNGTIFAYGQTSSGKTFTMQGGNDPRSRSCMGIVQMTARDIFSHIENEPNRDFLIRVSFIEIYNEQVRDLLVDNPEESNPLTVREDVNRAVTVNCKETVVTDFNSLVGILFAGQKNRIVKSTSMNKRSSRSHTIFRITMESREKMECDGDVDQGAVLISHLNLVDLAGSESVRHTGATGQRQREGGKINQSLLTLSQVIHSLGQSKKHHINFRDSKLTRILQPYLSGNAVMAIICCATASNLYLEETRSTLKFASRAKLVKTKARKNEIIDDRALIKQLQKELAEAHKELDRHVTMHQEREENESSAKAAEEKLIRLKSMILRGGMLHQQTPPTPKSRKSRSPTAAALVSPPLKQTPKISTSQPRNITKIFNFDSPSPTSDSDLSCFSVGVLHIPHRDISEYEFIDRSEINDITDSKGNNAIKSSVQKWSGRVNALNIEGKETKSPNAALNHASEVMILKEALAAKSDQSRVLKSELKQFESLVKTIRAEADGLSLTVNELCTEKNEAQQRIDELQAENDALKTHLKGIIHQHDLKSKHQSYFSYLSSSIKLFLFRGQHTLKNMARY